MKTLILLLFATTLLLAGCQSPVTTLRIAKADGTLVEFSHPKDVTVEGLEADLNKGTISIVNLQSTASSVIREQAGREQVVGDLVMKGLTSALVVKP